MTATANKSPIFTLTPRNGFAKVTGVDGSMDGTDADVKLVFTAQAVDGSFLQRLIAQPISSSGSTTTSAAALRIYMNNGSSVGTAANNQLIKEWSLAAITVNVAATVMSTGYEIPLNFQLAPGYAIYVGVTAMAANTQWNVTSIHGDYV
jgi:hypothetical protein